MKIRLTFFFCTLLFSAQAQSFQELIRSAEKFYAVGEFKKSVEKYQSAFEIKEGEATDYYNAACSSALLNKMEESISLLKTAATKGFRNNKHLKKDSDLKSLHCHKTWNEIIKLVEANLKEYEKDFDKDLKMKLDKIGIQDQTLRKLHKEATEKFGIDSEEMDFFWNLIAEQDSLNVIELVKLIEENGWIGKSLVGEEANTTIWLVIQHASLETQEKFLPLLKESVKKGESNAWHLALIEDRILIRKGKPQIYGSQVIYNDTTKKYVVGEIFEPELINYRRESVGLQPIEEYLKRWDIEWSIEQKTK